MNISNKLDIAVIILFFEKLDQTIETIQTFLPSEVTICVLDNASSAATRQELGLFCKPYKQVKIFDSPTNLGPAGGRNFLINHTSEQWLFIVDNDITVPTLDWLPRIAKHISQNPEIEVFNPELYERQDDEYSPHVAFEISNGRVKLNPVKVNGLTNMFHGGGTVVNRSLFNRIGLFDDRMFSLEEWDLSFRAILSGAPIKARFVSDVKVIHDHRPVTRDEDKIAITVRYDVDRIDASFKRLAQKHNIVLKDDWRPWVSKQVSYLSGGSRQQSYFVRFAKKWLRRLKRFARRIIVKPRRRFV